MARLTLEDVAKQAKVSRSTVSRVVNNQPNVREDVRKRVMKVIQATDFHPNAAARTLVSRRSWMIGLVIPRSVSSFFTDPYFPLLTQGITLACNQYDYTFALFMMGSKEDEEKTIPRVTRAGLLDGFILQSGFVGDHLFDKLIKSQVPFVIAGRPFEHKNVSYVDVDNVTSAYNATKHLISLGYKRIATITGPAKRCESMDRREGYIKALLTHGYEVDESLIIESDFTEAGGYAAMRQLLPLEPRAVFAASDVMAIGAIRATRDAGFSVPEDIAFVGFDDLPLTTISGLKLTTIRQPVVQFGAKAVEMLIDLIENGVKPARRLIMDTELIVRETCGASHQG